MNTPKSALNHIKTHKNQWLERAFEQFLSNWHDQLQKKTKNIPANSAKDMQKIFSGLKEDCAEYFKHSEKWIGATLECINGPIQCKAGCGTCCRHYPRSVDPFELVVIYQHIRQRDDFDELLSQCMRNDREWGKIIQQSDITEDCDPAAEDELLQKYFEKGLKCPFLSDQGECTIREVRPLTCRLYFSLSPAELCVPEFVQDDRNLNFELQFPGRFEGWLGDIAQCLSDLNLGDGLFEGIVAMNQWEWVFFEE